MRTHPSPCSFEDDIGLTKRANATKDGPLPEPLAGIGLEPTEREYCLQVWGPPVPEVTISFFADEDSLAMEAERVRVLLILGGWSEREPPFPSLPTPVHVDQFFARRGVTLSVRHMLTKQARISDLLETPVVETGYLLRRPTNKAPSP